MTKSTNLTLKCYETLFKNDKESFMDTKKIEIITNPLFDLIEALQIPKYSDFVKKNLSPCIVSLFNSITDDYKLKTLNYNVINIIFFIFSFFF